MRVPLQTIRFKGGPDVHMGILFWRRVSRAGVSVAWPPLEPGKWVFEKHASLGVRRAAAAADRARSSRRRRMRGTQQRDAPSTLGRRRRSRATSASAASTASRPTVTLDATVNPDFSQVESDAFQVEVNQRFPMFFSEKRPFFMEGAGIFTLAGQGNDNSLQAAVHTRRIVDPVFGAKVTGSLGRWAFGTLSALDQVARPQSARRAIPTPTRIGSSTSARVQYSLGPEQLRRRARRRHRVRRRLQPRRRRRSVVARELDAARQRVRARLDVARSARRPSRRAASARRPATSTTRAASIVIGYAEHYDRDFQMDTAFINRVGITSGWGYAEYNFYPPKTKDVAAARSRRSRSRRAAAIDNAGGNELLQVTGVRHAVQPAGHLPVRSVRRLRGLGRAAIRPRATGGCSAACSSIAG